MTNYLPDCSGCLEKAATLHIRNRNKTMCKTGCNIAHTKSEQNNVQNRLQHCTYEIGTKQCAKQAATLHIRNRNTTMSKTGSQDPRTCLCPEAVRDQSVSSYPIYLKIHFNIITPLSFRLSDETGAYTSTSPGYLRVPPTKFPVIWPPE